MDVSVGGIVVVHGNGSIYMAKWHFFVPKPTFSYLYYQSVASAAKDIKDVFIAFMGKSLVVKVIYAELLIVSRVKVRPKILWQEKLGRTIPWSKIYLHSYTDFFTNQEHDVFLECCTMCLRQVSISAPGLISISVWTALSVRVRDFRALAFELCLCKGGLRLGNPPLLRIAW